MKGICKKCCKVVDTKYEKRDINIKYIDSRYDIEVNTTVGVCVNCNDTVSVPAKSTPDIKKVIQNAPIV
tara:strand:- start:18063 stop:18269 length:207 start_codon:yes stop_codon:yes gene_type:complete